MDPITQAALGAVVGQACAGKQLGLPRAAAWGAVAGAFPDVDSLVGNLWSDDPLVRLQFHRGITHSLFFAPVIGPLLAWLLWRRQRLRGAQDQPIASYGRWLALITFALLSHPLLDFCTHYGTQLLSPFTDRRFALPAISIIDPRYTLMLFAGLLIAPFARKATLVSTLTLIVSTGYILLGLKTNWDAEAWAREDLELKGIPAIEVHAFPTLFQLPHRRIVARTDTTDYVGFVTMSEPCSIDWQPQPRYTGPEAIELRRTDEGQIFEWFANGLTTAYREGRRIVLADLRYGFTTDAREGNWMLEGLIIGAGMLESPRYSRNPRPSPSATNIRALWSEAYPLSCAFFSGDLEFSP